MLPAWATVLIALGGSAIGALAGVTGSYLTFRSTELTLRQSEVEAWRTRLVEAAEDFSRSMVRAIQRIDMATPTEHDWTRVPTQDEFDEIDVSTSETLTTGLRINLLFGAESSAGKASYAAVWSFGDARTALRSLRRAKPEERRGIASKAKEHREEANRMYGHFLGAAHQAINPERSPNSSRG
jgi:hypothetical protein